MDIKSNKLMYGYNGIFNEAILKENAVVIYGAGSAGISALAELKMNGVHPFCFIDIDMAKKGQSIDGLPIHGLDDVEGVGIRENHAIIITPAMFYEPITEDLKKKGYANLYYRNNPFTLADTFHFKMLAADAERKPTPPPVLTEWGECGEDHLSSGLRDFGVMRKELGRHGISISEMKRVFEFGCSNCRILRHFTDESTSIELFGADIQTTKVFWAMKNLPTLYLIVNNVTPPLPYCDGFFDFAFAGSVFTHLVEYHSAWMAELARVVMPGGHAYLSFHDEICSEHIANTFNGRPTRLASYSNLGFLLETEGLFDRFCRFDFDFLCGGPYHNDKAQADVFMSRKYIEKISKAFFELVAVIPDGYGGFQTAYLFRRK